MHEDPTAQASMGGALIQEHQDGFVPVGSGTPRIGARRPLAGAEEPLDRPCVARLLELGDGPTTVPREAIFNRVHPEDRARYLEAIARTTDPKGNGHLAIDVRALLPDGGVRG